MLKPALKLLVVLNRTCSEADDPRFPPFFTQDEMREILVESGQGWANRAIGYLHQHGYIQRAVGTDAYILTKDGADFAGPR